MINVYSSKFSAEPTETHKVTHGTVGAWLQANAPSYNREAPQQFSVRIDGELIHQCHWHDKLIDASSDVRIVVEPKGTELFLGALFVAATRMMTPKIPKMNNVSTEQGKALDSPTAKGNKVKVNQTRPEVAGRCKIYGNYTKPAVRRFHGPRDQRVSMCLDLGVGDIDVNSIDVGIGGTNAFALGDDVEFSIYPPGADISGDPRSEWWHDVVEVGSGSNGSSGLDLTFSEDIPASYQASSHVLNGNELTIPVGSGEFPEGWTAGMIIRLSAPYPYNVGVDSSGGLTVSGPNVTMLAPFVGQHIEVDGLGAGQYLVRSYTPYSPSVPEVKGRPASVTGSSPPSTFDFSASPESFSVTIGGINYPHLIASNTVDLNGLAWTINNQRPAGASYEATVSGSMIKVLDINPTNTGRPIYVSGGQRIFGLSLVVESGIADSGGTPEQPATISLNGMDGSQVTGFPLGAQLLSIAPYGMRYRITAAGPNTLSLSRLTSTGSPDPSFPGFNYIHTASVVVTLDPSNLQGGWRGPFAACPEGELAGAIQWDIFYPQGLCGIGREGRIYRIDAFQSLEWRDMDIAGPWTRVDIDQGGDSRDAQGFTYHIWLPYAMRPEVRICKRNQRLPGRAEGEAQNQAAWYGLRALMHGNKTTYPDSTILCLTARAGDRIASEAEAQVWVRGTRKLPVRRGGAWQPAEPTRDIVPFCLHVLKSAGYDDSDLDLPEWDALDALLRSRGDTYDRIFTEGVTVLQAVEEALSCGFARLTTKNGLLTPVRDQPQSFFKHLYTSDTQVEDGELDIRFDTPSGDDYDAVDVQFIDQVKWQTATVRCRVPGAPQPKRIKTVTADGITSRLQAYRFGMRELMDLMYRRKTCEWGTEMSALNSNYLDLVKVCGDTPGYAQSHVMATCSADRRTITARQPIDATGISPPYMVAVRRIDGACFGPVRASLQGDKTLVLETALDFDPILDQPGVVEPPYIMFGQGYSVLIDDIIPDGTESARVRGTFYDERLYQYDDAPLPPGA